MPTRPEAVGGHDPGRSVPQRGPRGKLVAGAPALGRPAPAPVVRRRLRQARRALDLGRSARPAARCRRRLVRRGLGDDRRRRSWRLGGHGLRAAYMPPEQAGDPEIQDPHRLVRCEASPDSFWIQHHNGVFRAVDGIDRWTEIATPQSVRFAVAVHPRDPDTAWFVPGVKDEFRYPADGRLVVTRTRDGGSSFEVLTEGLPQTDAYDLVYRHGLEVDEMERGSPWARPRAAFGSATMPGNAGRSRRPDCRRSTPCGSRDSYAAFLYPAGDDPSGWRGGDDRRCAAVREPDSSRTAARGSSKGERKCPHMAAMSGTN